MLLTISQIIAMLTLAVICLVSLAYLLSDSGDWMPRYKYLNTQDRVILSFILFCGFLGGIGGSLLFYLIYTLFFMG